MPIGCSMTAIRVTISCSFPSRWAVNSASSPIESPAAVVDWLQRFIDELRVCLHGCGAANLLALRRRGVTKL